MAQKDLSFATALAEAMSRERSIELSKDPVLNNFIEESVSKFGENLFELVEVEDEV